MSTWEERSGKIDLPKDEVWMRHEVLFQSEGLRRFSQSFQNTIAIR